MPWRRWYRDSADGLAAMARELTINQQTIVVGVVVGGASGLGAFFFDGITHWAGVRLVDYLIAFAPRWRSACILLLPALGAAIGASLIKAFSPEAKGHGVDEVHRAIREAEGHISGRVAVVKFVASALTIGFGGSAGREGPVIHIGGSVGSWLGRRLKVSTQNLKMLVAAGACSGLAVSFGVPLAAVFFTMEVLLRDFANESFPAVVIASVSGIATTAVFGGPAHFHPATSYVWNGPWDIFVYSALGLMCAPLGALYMGLLRRVEAAVENDAQRFPAWAYPAMGGVVVGAIALVFPEVMGTGQDTIEAALVGGLGGWRCGALTLAKILATVATLGSGGSGGAFMPAMFVGSAAGSAWATLASALLPLSVPRAAFAITGMSCVVTAAFKAPVTSMILALELSRDYGILMPVMIACILAHLVTRDHRPTPMITR